MTTTATEAALEPDLPIIDSHHHLGDKIPAAAFLLTGGRTRYVIDEYVEDMDSSGHLFLASVQTDGESMYRQDGPVAMRVVGETEFINGQAAMGASGMWGPVRVADAIVGRANLGLGDEIRPVLEAHITAGNGRLRGVRQTAAWDADPTVLGGTFSVGEHLYARDSFRRGFAHLAQLGLTFDAFVLAPQLPDVLALAQAFPDTSIILDHTGQPVGVGGYKGRRDELFDQWERDIRAIAQCRNVSIKLGGLGSFIAGFDSFMAGPAVGSDVLAAEWGPYITACIDAFGPERCMFESNYPVDHGAGPFGDIWNAFKRITASHTRAEREEMFAGTAARTYKMDLAELTHRATMLS